MKKCRVQRYVWTRDGNQLSFKVGPMYETYKGEQKGVALGQLALNENLKMPEAILAGGKVSRTGTELKELTNCLAVTKDHFSDGFWKTSLTKELKQYGFSKVPHNQLYYEKQRFLGPHPKFNPPIDETGSHIPKIVLEEVVERLSKAEDDESPQKSENHESPQVAEIPELLDKNLAPEERVAVYKTVVQDVKKQKASVAPEKTEELAKTLETNKLDYTKAATQLCNELERTISQYFQQDEKTDQYEQRRKQLAHEFDQLSALFDLKWSIQSFQSMKREQIFPKLQSEIHVDSFQSQIQMMHEFTQEVSKHSDQLTKDLEIYIQSCNQLDSQRKSLKQIDQSIKDYYERKLKKWERWSRHLNKLSFFTGSAQGISGAIQIVRASVAPATAGLSMASLVVNGASTLVNRRNQRLTHQFENQLAKHKDVHGLLGFLSDSELDERLRLEEDKREEAEFLLQHRSFVLSDKYQDLQNKNLEWFEKDKDDKLEKISKKESELKQLEECRKKKEEEKNQKFGNVIRGEKKINQYNELKLEIKEFELKEKAKKKEIEQLQKGVDADRDLRDRVEKDLELAGHVSDLVKYRESLEAQVKLPTKEEREEQVQLQRLFKTMDHGRELWYRRTAALSNGVRPILEEVDFWTDSPIASSSLDALMFAYKGVVNGQKIYDFTQAVSLLKGNDTWEKLGKVEAEVLLNQCILPALSTIHVGLTLVHLAYNATQWYEQKDQPRKDPHIEALRMFFEHNQKLLDERLGELQRNQNLQHSGLLKQIDELKDHFEKIHDRFDSAALIEMDNSILSSRQKFEKKITTSPTFDTIFLQLQHARERNLNGSNFDLGENPSLDSVIRYPYMYTGFLYNQLGYSESCSNLYLWDSAVHQLVHHYDENFSREKHQKQLESSVQDLQTFERLVQFPTQKIKEAAQLSQNAIKELTQIRFACQKLGKARQKEQLNTAIDNRGYSPLLAHDKFFFNQLVHEIPLNTKNESLTDSAVWDLPSYFMNLNNRATTLIFSEPINWALNRKERWSNIQEFNPINIVWNDRHEVQAGVNKITKLLAQPFAKAKNMKQELLNHTFEFSEWTEGEVIVTLTSMEDRAMHPTCVKVMAKDGGPFSGYFTKETAKKVEVVQQKTFLELEMHFYMRCKLIFWWKTTSNSVLKSDDLEKIPSKYFIDRQAGKVDDGSYYGSLDSLCSGYFKVLYAMKKNEKQIKGPFREMLNECQALPSQSGKLIPLALPKAVIDTAEKAIHYDRFLIETSGTGTLTPSYDFALNQTGDFYDLSIVFDFDPTDQNQNKVPFCKMVIASIDKLCVNAWKDKKDELQLNELLIQWLYTGYESEIGMPGKRSHPIYNGEYFAPAEEPFPGIYKLMKDEPGIIQVFDSSKYEKVEDVIHQQPFKLEFNGVQALKVKLEAEKQVRDFITRSSAFEKYRFSYELVMAYCTLVSSLKSENLALELDKKLHLLPPNDLVRLFVEMGHPRENELAVMDFEQQLKRNPSKTVNHLERHKKNLEQLMSQEEEVVLEQPEEKFSIL